MGATFFTPQSGGEVSSATYVILAADATTTSPTGVDVAGLAFTPAPLTSYHVIAVLALMTADATAGARAGIALPTGVTAQCGKIDTVNNTNTTPSTRLLGASGAHITGNTAFPDAINAWPVFIDVLFKTGASVTDDFRIQFSNEVSGTQTTIKAGSWLSYEVVA